MDLEKDRLARITQHRAPDDAREEIQKLRDLLASSPDPSIREWLAFRLYTCSRYNEAIAEYQTLLLEKYRMGDQFFQLGNIYAKMGQKEDAIQAWSKALEHISSGTKAEKARARLEEIRKKGKAYF